MFVGVVPVAVTTKATVPAVVTVTPNLHHGGEIADAATVTKMIHDGQHVINRTCQPG